MYFLVVLLIYGIHTTSIVELLYTVNFISKIY
jgi:hypothetical protein